MTYRVQPTAQAEADIDRIFAWLSERSPEGARRWYESFWDSAERLKTMPLCCGFAPENDDFNDEVRLMLFGTRRGRTYTGPCSSSGATLCKSSASGDPTNGP